MTKKDELADKYVWRPGDIVVRKPKPRKNTDEIELASVEPIFPQRRRTRDLTDE